MRVKDLIQLLQKENPDSTVVTEIPTLIYDDAGIVVDRVESLAVINGVTRRETIYLEWTRESA